MHRFRVWGPRAKRVSVVVDGKRYAMESEPRGWWSATVEKAQAGSIDMSMGTRAGALPSKWTTPVMEPAVAGSTAGAGLDCAVSTLFGAASCLQPVIARAVRRRSEVERRVTIVL